MVERTVLVTGGLGGIGRAVAHAFARAGDRIALVDFQRNDDAFSAQLIDEGASGAVGILADVGSEQAISQAVDAVLERFGSLDVLVNVAGMMIYKPVAELTGADWDRLLRVNLVGAALFTGHALRVMRPGGCIINVASVHARRTSALVAPYAAAKAALVSLTRSSAIEGKSLGIRVNAILPGAIDTPMLHNSPTIKSGEEVLSPDDVGYPVDIAQLALFLASNEASFITGEDVVVDGGRMGRL